LILYSLVKYLKNRKVPLAASKIFKGVLNESGRKGEEKGKHNIGKKEKRKGNHRAYGIKA